MLKFKVGDEVTLINVDRDYGSNGVIGNVYIIRSTQDYDCSENENDYALTAKSTDYWCNWHKESWLELVVEKTYLGGE